jgi:four helix bundle protein
MNSKIQTHKDLIVWQKSVDLVLDIYKITETFPKEERYGLTSQLRRATVSIPSNIAEGKYRGSRKDFAHFLRIALGSSAEIETQILVANKLGWLKEKDFVRIGALLSEVGKMLNGLCQKLVAGSRQLTT